MRRAILAVAVLLAGNTPAAAPRSLQQQYEALRKAGVDTSRSAPVKNLVLEDSDVRLVLSDGVFFPLEAVGGPEHGGVFLGSGRLFYSPPDDTEAAAMERFVAASSLTVPHTGLEVEVDEQGDIQVRVQAFKRDLILDRPFQAAVLRFSPDQWKRLGLTIESTPGRDAQTAAKIYRERHDLQRTVVDKDQDGFDIDLRVLESHLPAAEPPSFLLADLQLDGFAFKRPGTGRGSPWLSYWRSDDEAEEHQLYVLERRTEARNLDRAVREGGSEGGSEPESPGTVGGEGAQVLEAAAFGTNLDDERRSPGLQRTLIASFHDQEERRRYPRILLASEKHPRIDLLHHELSLTIDKGDHAIHGNATLTFEALHDDTHWVAFRLANAQPKPDNLATLGKLHVTAAQDADGKPLEWVHRGGTVLVRLSHSAARGEHARVKLQWSGNVIWPSEATGAFEALPGQRVGSSGKGFRNYGLDFLPLPGQSFSPLAGFPWVPQTDPSDPFTTDWTVCVPRRLRAIIPGVTDREWKKKGQRCVHATETHPVRQPAVFMGMYDCEDKKLEGLPRVRVCAYPRQFPGTRGYIAEAKGLLGIYQVLFGKYPFDELEIVQLGFDDTRSFSAPGIVALEGRAFISKQALANASNVPGSVGMDQAWTYEETRGNAVVDVNLRHELLAEQTARQWWGHKVSPRTYRDQWLVDAVSRYAAGIYMSRLRKDDGVFDNQRIEWFQQAILNDWGGPLDLGPRLRETYGPAAQNKGPAVLHMLRGELGSDPFFSCLHTYLDLAAGRSASTEELRWICERTHGTQLDWFFDTWIRRAGIPKIDYTYRVVPREKDDKFDLELSIHQKGTHHKLRLPLVVEFGDKKQWVGVFVTDDSQETTLPGLPERPTKVRVDAEWLLASHVSGKKQ